MAVKKVPGTYAASDGQEFDDEEEAKRHDELITARQEYDDARKKFNRVLAQTQKTADGETFDFGLFTSYYYITDYYYTQPSLKHVNFLGWNFEIDEHDDSVEISQAEGETGREHRFSCKISRLYVSKKRAEIALINALESWLDEQRRTVNEIKKDLRGSPTK